MPASGGSWGTALAVALLLSACAEPCASIPRALDGGRVQIAGLAAPAGALGLGSGGARLGGLRLRGGADVAAAPARETVNVSSVPFTIARYLLRWDGGGLQVVSQQGGSNVQPPAKAPIKVPKEVVYMSKSAAAVFVGLLTTSAGTDPAPRTLKLSWTRQCYSVQSSLDRSAVFFIV